MPVAAVQVEVPIREAVVPVEDPIPEADIAVVEAAEAVLPAVDELADKKKRWSDDHLFYCW
jgi:hypothetical protein